MEIWRPAGDRRLLSAAGGTLEDSADREVGYRKEILPLWFWISMSDQILVLLMTLFPYIFSFSVLKIKTGTLEQR